MRVKCYLAIPIFIFVLVGNSYALNGITSLLSGMFSSKENALYTPEQITSRIETHLAGADYLSALTLAGSARHNGHTEELFKGQYSPALNGVLKEADHHLRNRDALEAGLLYRTALFFFPQNIEIRNKSEFTLEEINTALERCADQLLEAGLLSYRQQNYEEAINQWESITLFLPNHVPSQQAIQTTQIQLANLSRLKQD